MKIIFQGRLGLVLIWSNDRNWSRRWSIQHCDMHGIKKSFFVSQSKSAAKCQFNMVGTPPSFFCSCESDRSVIQQLLARNFSLDKTWLLALVSRGFLCSHYKTGLKRVMTCNGCFFFLHHHISDTFIFSNSLYMFFSWVSDSEIALSFLQRLGEMLLWWILLRLTSLRLGLCEKAACHPSRDIVWSTLDYFVFFSLISVLRRLN